MAQTLRDSAHAELSTGIDRLVGCSLESSRKSGVYEMSETLLTEDRQRCGDAIENTSDVYVDYLLPVFDPQLVVDPPRKEIHKC